jgi:prolyl-tRNA synthetase
MLQSKLFTKTKRESPKDEEAINAQLLIRAGFIDKLMAGVYTFLPLGGRRPGNFNAVASSQRKLGNNRKMEIL